MLEIVEFTNGRYGLRHHHTQMIVDREWRTLRGVKRALKKRVENNKRMRDRIFARQLMLRSKVKVEQS